jgi:hypothetical protein
MVTTSLSPKFLLIVALNPKESDFTTADVALSPENKRNNASAICKKNTPNETFLAIYNFPPK